MSGFVLWVADARVSKRNSTTTCWERMAAAQTRCFWAARAGPGMYHPGSAAGGDGPSGEGSRQGLAQRVRRTALGEPRNYPVAVPMPSASFPIPTPLASGSEDRDAPTGLPGPCSDGARPGHLGPAGRPTSPCHRHHANRPPSVSNLPYPWLSPRLFSLKSCSFSCRDPTALPVGLRKFPPPSFKSIHHRPSSIPPLLLSSILSSLHSCTAPPELAPSSIPTCASPPDIFADKHPRAPR